MKRSTGSCKAAYILALGAVWRQWTKVL